MRARRDPEAARPPRPPPDRGTLEAAARRYLQRYWPTVAQLRKVLLRRLPEEGPPAMFAQVRADVELVLADLVESGALNDERAARAWAEQLDRRGTARPALRHKMRSKGLSAEHTEAAVTAVDAAATERGVSDPELARAVAAARRKRLGPFRRDLTARADRRDRDLAALARLGFPFAFAKAVIDADDEDAAEALATA
ncbi:MAG: RecX family transcriptional regulator [Deltaproteobacteria bacterium]|nr:RecX family transcriptional regulator [Deltaproteobacteria bacterium]